MLADRLAKVRAASRRRIAACLWTLLIAGCQQQPTTVSGTITLDGQPLKVAANARGTVVFQPASGQGTMATGLIDAAGQFRLATGGSIEVEPGQYQVAVSVLQLLPKQEGVEQSAELITPAKYASAHESGLQAEIVPNEENQLRFNLISGVEPLNSTVHQSRSDSASEGESLTGNVPTVQH